MNDKKLATAGIVLFLTAVISLVYKLLTKQDFNTEVGLIFAGIAGYTYASFVETNKKVYLFTFVLLALVALKFCFNI